MTQPDVVLNEAFLLSVLPAILGVDPKYVVPRQGNWFNAQDGTPRPTKPMTWCAFAIEDERPVDIPSYVPDPAPRNWSVQHAIASLAIQFVGPDAKKLATSVGHWFHRSDVFLAFSQVDGSVLGPFGVTVVDFTQDGLNTVKAYTARIRVVYASEIDSGQAPVGPGQAITSFKFGGGVG